MAIPRRPAAAALLLALAALGARPPALRPTLREDSSLSRRAQNASRNRARSAAAAMPLPGRLPGLSARERAARIRELSDDDRRWLTEYVEPLILPDETSLFLALPAGYPREIFREEFWSRREREGLPPPLGPGYRVRYGHLREVATADYDGLHFDAGRMVVRRGEPIQELKECSEVYRQAEVWTYPPDGTAGREARHLFYRPSFDAPRRLWLPGDTSEEIRGRGASAESAAGFSAPAVPTEGLEALWQRLATSSNPAPRSRATGAPSPASVGPPEAASERTAARTPEEIRQRIVELPKKYRDFLDLAAPVMSYVELVQFLELPPSARDGFIRKF